MSAFLENTKPFLGSGKKNEDNLSLDEYLETYDADKYKKPSVTADVMVFSYDKNSDNFTESLKLLMVKRKNHPSIGYWALPGGFAEMREDLMQTAKRELEEETGLTNIPIVQVYTYGEYTRDPRDRVVTTSYLALVEDGSCKAVAGDDAAEAEWWNVKCNVISEQDVERDGFIQRQKEYELKLYCNNLNKEISGIVTEFQNISSLLKEKDYEVKSSNEIAFDHARFIVMGLEYIKEKCI